MTEGNRYTQERLQQKITGIVPVKKKKKYILRKTPVKKISDKRVEENKIYQPLSQEFRKKFPRCVIKSPECTKFTQGVHHVEGRVGDDFLDESKMLPSCNACNNYIESHSKWAKENGFKKPNYKSKLSKLNESTSSTN